MKSAGIILLIFLSYSVSEAANPSISNLRHEIFALNQNSGLAQELLIKLEKIENPSSLVIAYRAVCQAHIAKISSNPFEKYFYIQKANKQLAQAVEMGENNIEVRFLRFAVQVQSPGILGFQKNIEEDERVLINNFSSHNWNNIDRTIIKYICNFMIENGAYTQYELDQLNCFLNEIS